MSDELVREVKAELTVTPVSMSAKTYGAKPPSFELWRVGPTRMYVPKCYGLAKFGTEGLRDSVKDGSPFPKALKFAGSLRQEQLEPVRAYMAAAEDPRKRGGILSLPCGCGKTVLALYLTAHIGRKTLIVVHKNFLLEQWKKRIEEFLPGARIGLIKAKTVDVVDKDVVLASLQSLSMKTYDASVFADIGLLIIDEVHHTGAEVFSRALQKTNVRRSLGLSATVTRKDGMTKVFAWYIGDVVYAMKSGDDEVDVIMKRYMSRDEAYSEEPMGYGGALNMSRMINNVCRYAPRTELIVEYVREILTKNPGRKALVLSDRLEHLDAIKRGIECTVTETDTPENCCTCGMYVGGMKARDLAESETKRVILATYNFASEGFDVPGLDTLFMASPKTDIEQSVGRVLRQKASDRKNVPLIIDFVDGFSVFEGQAKKRKAFYAKKKYNIRLLDEDQIADFDGMANKAKDGTAEEPSLESDDECPPSEEKEVAEYSFQCDDD
jgi:superfamily II DNA or RNA helicase